MNSFLHKFWWCFLKLQTCGLKFIAMSCRIICLIWLTLTVSCQLMTSASTGWIPKFIFAEQRSKTIHVSISFGGGTLALMSWLCGKKGAKDCVVRLAMRTAWTGMNKPLKLQLHFYLSILVACWHRLVLQGREPNCMRGPRNVQSWDRQASSWISRKTPCYKIDYLIYLITKQK